MKHPGQKRRSQACMAAIAFAGLVGLIPSGGALSGPAQAGEVYSTGHSCNNKSPGKKFDKEYFIYFDTNSSRLDPKYHGDIQRIFEIAKGQNVQQICLFGKSSKTGDAAANAALSRKRSANVAQAFENLGWPAAQIAIEYEGEAWGWLEETLTWDAEEDRRVRIRLSM
ncbi:MAG: OmpA family protein [Parvibaculum sp.]